MEMGPANKKAEFAANTLTMLRLRVMDGFSEPPFLPCGVIPVNLKDRLTTPRI